MYPALVVDRHWNVVRANRGAARLFGDELVGTNLVRRYFGDPSAADAIVNWRDVAWAGLTRLRDQVEASPFDDELRALFWSPTRKCATPPGRSLSAAEMRHRGPRPRRVRVIRTVGMVMRFDTAIELTLDELRIELTYPADETARRFFLGG